MSNLVELTVMGQAAQGAKYCLQNLKEEKNKVLLEVATALEQKEDLIMEANKEDLKQAIEKGMQEGLVDRLRLTSERIKAMSQGIREVTQLADPIGEILEEIQRPNGLNIKKIRVPMGVIGIIYESRPNVTADAFSLCFKTGNAVILKGGSDAIHSNLAITQVIRETLERMGVEKDALQLIQSTDRSVTKEFMRLKEYVDVLIPRGGAGLIRNVVENSTIPVIETGTGNCHIYVDESADLEKAAKIIYNAKTQRIGVCNACESLVIHEAVYKQFLPTLKEILAEKKVEIRGDEKVLQVLPDATKATKEDYGTEYLDYILSVKIVSNLEEAIRHINQYSTKHSESIISESEEHIQQFLGQVDAACVYANASTRFTDGFEFGFGAEIGISTQKLHARGPMGLKELTSYKYIIMGNGQIRE